MLLDALGAEAIHSYCVGQESEDIDARGYAMIHHHLIGEEKH